MNPLYADDVLIAYLDWLRGVGLCEPAAPGSLPTRQLTLQEVSDLALTWLAGPRVEEEGR